MTQRTPSAPGQEGHAPPGDAFHLTLKQRVYLWLAGIFVTCLLIADITGSKFFHFGEANLLGHRVPIEHSVGMFAFPITFILTDLINEHFGSKGARRITFLALAMAALAFLLIYLARVAPPAPPDRTFIPEDMFDRVFGMSNRLYVASLTAFLLGQLTDIFLFRVLRRLTRGKLLWLRATGSTLVSQGVDSLTISFVLGFGTTLADGSRATVPFILETAAKGYFLKFCIALAATPLIYLGHAALRAILARGRSADADPNPRA